MPHSLRPLPSSASLFSGLLPAGLFLAGSILSAPAQAQGDAVGGTWIDPPSKSAGSEGVPAPAELERPPLASGQNEQASPPRSATVERSRATTLRRERPSVAPAQASRSPRPEERISTHAVGPAARPAIDEVAMPGASGRLATLARRTTVDYLAAVSSNVAMASSADRFYGDRVRFHGRLMSRTALAAEKARFARRWPDRRYEPRGEARTRCDAVQGVCSVTTAFDFQAANGARRARSTGIGELTVVIGFTGERPTILSESSRVLRRGSSTLSAGNRSGDAG